MRKRLPLLLSVAAVLGIAGAFATASLGGGSRAAIEDSVPESAKASATAVLEGRYGGTNLEVYGEAATTLENFVALEPLRNQGYEVTADSAEDPVYAVFVRGSFEVKVPDLSSKSGSGFAHFEAGRVVVGADGSILSVALWPAEKAARDGFGQAFDEG